MALYEILVLGSPKTKQLAAIRARVKEIAKDFDLAMSSEIAIRRSADLRHRNPKSASVALYFGGDPAVDMAAVQALENAKIPIIPVLQDRASVTASIPVEIQATNAFFIQANDRDLHSLASVVFECLGLLRQQRRVFVSYRRTDTRSVAVQLHDQLSARGFDVFLDTHDIRPGEQFQEMLWHRLVDCDVVIMLDSQNYFESKWTKQELGRTLAKGIHILRLIWPSHKSSRHLSLSETMRLSSSDFDPSMNLIAPTIDAVVKRTEVLRSRSIATRHREISGKLVIEVQRMGGTFEGIGLYRSMSLSLPNGTKVHAYPVVGVPSAELLNDVQNKAVSAGQQGLPCLVYDHIGIRDGWLAHLSWLDQQITSVRTLKVMDASWELAKWDS